MDVHLQLWVLFERSFGTEELTVYSYETFSLEIMILSVVLPRKITIDKFQNKFWYFQREKLKRQTRPYTAKKWAFNGSHSFNEWKAAFTL